AEDGIRDFHVTGVQTCALPISGYSFMAFVVGLVSVIGMIGPIAMMRAHKSPRPPKFAGGAPRGLFAEMARCLQQHRFRSLAVARSEERRVGKEGRSRGARARGR